MYMCKFHEVKGDSFTNLLSKEKLYALKHLVTKQSCDSYVEKQTIEHRGGDVGQDRCNQNGQANQNV